MRVLFKFLVALLLYAVQYTELGCAVRCVRERLTGSSGGCKCLITVAASSASVDHRSTPNLLVAVSLLGSFACCPWTQLAFRTNGRPHGLPAAIGCAVDAWLTAWLSAALMRQLWMPAVDVAYHLCQDAAAFAADVVSGRCADDFRALIGWLRSDAVLLVRGGLAAGCVWLMLVVTGVQAAVCRRWFEWFGRAPGDVAEMRRASFGGGHSLEECCQQFADAGDPAVTRSATNLPRKSAAGKSPAKCLRSRN